MTVLNTLSKNGIKVTAITGGIGSGKSIVSRILRIMGYEVYDCDSEAKLLMDSSTDIKDALVAEFGESVVGEGRINRQELSKIVFGDDNKLRKLNEIVHSHVKEHLSKWISSRRENAFVETAILYQSGLDKFVDEVWEIMAPKEIRLLRAISRDNSSEEMIQKRIDAQDSFVPSSRHTNVYQIINDGDIAVLPQVLSLL